MKDPAFLFYSQDFLVGTMTMSFEDRGKYITILSLMHQQGRMSEETIRLLVGSISDNLKNKFSVDDNGLYFNNRLETEIEKRNKFIESRVNNGVKGGRPKKENKPTNNLVVNTSKASEKLIENENVIENVDYNKIVSMFNLICTKLPKVEKITESRKIKIKNRFKDIGSYEEIESIFKIASLSDFLNGENNNNWRASFDWIMENDKNWLKIKEGQYNNKPKFKITLPTTTDFKR